MNNCFEIRQMVPPTVLKKRQKPHIILSLYQVTVIMYYSSPFLFKDFIYTIGRLRIYKINIKQGICSSDCQYHNWAFVIGDPNPFVFSFILYDRFCYLFVLCRVLRALIIDSSCFIYIFSSTTIVYDLPRIILPPKKETIFYHTKLFQIHTACGIELTGRSKG